MPCQVAAKRRVQVMAYKVGRACLSRHWRLYLISDRGSLSLCLDGAAHNGIWRATFLWPKATKVVLLNLATCFLDICMHGPSTALRIRHKGRVSCRPFQTPVANPTCH